MTEQEHTRAPVSGAEFAGMGAAFAITILLGLFAGQWLDRKLGTTPIITIGGLFIAAAAAFYGMYRKLVLRQRGTGTGSKPPGDQAP